MLQISCHVLDVRYVIYIYGYVVLYLICYTLNIRQSILDIIDYTLCIIHYVLYRTS